MGYLDSWILICRIGTGPRESFGADPAVGPDWRHGTSVQSIPKLMESGKSLD